MKNKIVHYVLPTYSPDEFYRNVVGNLNFYKKIADFISIGVNFQPPWTQTQIKEVAELFTSNGIDFRYVYNDHYFKDSYAFPLQQMRDDALSLNPTAKYYCIIDDDIIYTCSDEQYCQLFCSSIQYMERYNVGTLIWGEPVWKEWANREHDDCFHPWYKTAWTSLGLLIKNIYGGKINPKITTAGQEDVLDGVTRTIFNGFEQAFAAIAFGSHTGPQAKTRRPIGDY